MRFAVLPAFFFAVLFLSNGAHGAREQVTIDAALTKKALGPHLSYYVDTTGKLGVGDVSAESFAPRFIRNAGANLGMGYTRAAVWVRFATYNPAKYHVPYYLEFAYAIVDYLELYVPDGNGFRSLRTGDHHPFSSRPVSYRSFVFPMKAPPGLETCYLRVRSSGTMTIPLIAWAIERFEKTRDSELLALGIYYGIMLALAFYQLFIFFSVRERSYLYLLLFLLGVSFFTLAQNGLAFQYLWPTSVWWANQSHPFWVVMTILWVVLFTRSFLSTSPRLPRLDLALRALAYASAPAVIIVFVVEYFYATQLTVLFAAVSVCLLITTGITGLIEGHREARFYMLACLSFLVGAGSIALMAYGLLPESYITTWGVQIGSSLMALLLSLGVADKINTIRSERERAMERLRESDERYKTLVENALDGIMLLIDEVPVYSNPALARMLGYSNEELAAKRLPDLLPDNEMGRLVLGYYNARIAGKSAPTQYEAQLMDKKGAVIDVLISASRITISGRMGVIAIITNTTFARHAEKTILQQYQEIRSQYEELEAMNEELMQTHNEILDINDRLVQEKEQLTATLRSIEDAVITTDNAGTVVLMNSAAERLTGLQQQEAVGRHVWMVLDLKEFREPGMRGSKPDPVLELFEKGEISSPHVPFLLQSRSGANRVVEVNGAPIRVRNGHAMGMVLAVRDVTEKIRLENEMLKMGKIESLGVLAGGIAHDFNNILTAIIGNLSIAKVQIREKEDCLDTVDSIEHAALRAVNLTRQMLTFSKGGEPVKRTTSIVDLLKESVSFILSGSNVKSEFHIQEDIWLVDVDADQISQVLNNVVINAMQAMPGGGVVSVLAGNVSDPPGVPLSRGRYVKISVADQGIGIPAENLGKIFDPYFTTKEQGSGLGLASSYSIVTKHQGYIHAESVPGKGSTFHIYLRASEGAEEQHEHRDYFRARREGRILVMDDEEYMRQVSKKMLEYLGYGVETASEGLEAVEKYRAALNAGRRFDAVVMDLTVPGGMGGSDAIRALREIDPGVVAIVSSGYYNDPVMANYREHGFSGVIAKPFELHTMLGILDEALNHGPVNR